MTQKNDFFQLINENITEYGYHVTVVNDDIDPRYAYTIGLTPVFGFELIFAGGSYYLFEDLFLIFKLVYGKLKEVQVSKDTIQTISLGDFEISKVDQSWSQFMALGVYDYYQTNNVTMLQIKPDKAYFTLDIPDMSNKYSDHNEPVWKWLNSDWDLPVPSSSKVVTHLSILQGRENVNEIMRWELDQWEMFSADPEEINKEDIRVVSLGTVLGIDSSLYPAISLSVGSGILRDSANKSVWNDW